MIASTDNNEWLVKRYLENLWRWKVGLPERQITAHTPSLESLIRTEWSTKFERLMRNRLVVGAFRYGCIGESDKDVDHRIRFARERLDAYERTRNTECLVDVANAMLLEFVEGKHPKKHFHAVDRDR